MGFQVNITAVTAHVAQCAEHPCHWVGPERTLHHKAEMDAAAHISLHYEWWQKYNQAIEYLEETGENLIVEYYDDLTYPAVPRSSHPYTGDRSRFDYSHFDSVMATKGLDTGLAER